MATLPPYIGGKLASFVSQTLVSAIEKQRLTPSRVKHKLVGGELYEDTRPYDNKLQCCRISSAAELVTVSSPLVDHVGIVDRDEFPVICAVHEC